MPTRFRASIAGLAMAIVFAALLFVPAVQHVIAQSSNQYPLLRKPTVSETQIAFSYGGDLWIVDRGGGDAKRLTSDMGIEIDPCFLPMAPWSHSQANMTATRMFTSFPRPAECRNG